MKQTRCILTYRLRHTSTPPFLRSITQLPYCHLTLCNRGAYPTTPFGCMRASTCIEMKCVAGCFWLGTLLLAQSLRRRDVTILRCGVVYQGLIDEGLHRNVARSDKTRASLSDFGTALKHDSLRRQREGYEVRCIGGGGESCPLLGQIEELCP